MTKLPKKFEFCTKYNRADKHVLEYFEEGMYRYLAECGYGPNYTAAFVQGCVNEGSWIITKDLDEPELVFPFTAVAKHTPKEIAEEETFTAHRSECNNYEMYTSYPDGAEYVFSLDSCKKFIKDGTWIVKSVGEKVTETVEELDFIQKGQFVSDGTISDLPIKVTIEGFDETMERLEKLRQAYEDVNIAMESVIALQKELKGVL